ncbi:hypothetical protein [Acuticoccus sp.]|uniref:hypothetical protein n=1 Tax=Acuticoccus sp. TaxID=1904378 RepID=UPI003B52AC3E
MEARKSLRIRMFGPFAAWVGADCELDLRSTKAKALLALCATAPDGRRTRAFVQDTLWGLSGTTHGRASLRQTLSALRRLLGEDFDTLFVTTNETVGLRLDRVDLVGAPFDGTFLEGLEIPEPGFRAWVDGARRSPPAPHGNGVRATASAGAPVPAVPALRVAPIIAVIPFAGLDEEGMGRHLGDAIAQDVTRSLSRSPYLRVISHLSCRDRRLRQADICDVRAFLEADYVVSGQVRLCGEAFRLDVDFVDLESGELEWTRDFSGTIPSFFAGRDEVIQLVADATVRAILKQSLAPVGVTPLPDVASHRLLMAAIALMHRMALSSFAKARECLEEVLHRAPREAMLHAWLAKWYVLSIHQGWSVDPQRDAATGKGCVARALDLDPSCSFSLSVAGFVHHHLRELDEAFALHTEALAIDPNNALAWLMKGALHTFRDEGEEAVRHTERARVLSPLDPHRYWFDSIAASSHAANEEYELALELADLSLRANRRHTSTLRVRTYALEMLGRHEEARRSANELLRLEPGFTVEKYLSTHPAAQYQVGRRLAEVFQRTGVPLH